MDEPNGVAAEEAPHAATYESGSLAGIPESGRERIARMKQDVARGFFTSDLSVNEFLLVKQAGLRAARPGARQLDLPHRLPAGELEPEPGARAC